MPSAIGAGAALSQAKPDRPASSTSGFTSLQDETRLGGHAYRNHVDTTIQEAERDVVKRANSSRYFKRGTQRRGVFNSLEEANRLVAAALEANPGLVRQVASGASQQAEINMLFSQSTGLEASATAGSGVASINITYRLIVVLRASLSDPRGYYILTAYPTNKL